MLIESITQGACRSRSVVISFTINFDTEALEIFPANHTVNVFPNGRNFCSIKVPKFTTVGGGAKLSEVRFLQIRHDTTSVRWTPFSRNKLGCLVNIRSMQDLDLPIKWIGSRSTVPSKIRNHTILNTPKRGIASLA